MVRSTDDDGATRQSDGGAELVGYGLVGGHQFQALRLGPGPARYWLAEEIGVAEIPGATILLAYGDGAPQRRHRRPEGTAPGAVGGGQLGGWA